MMVMPKLHLPTTWYYLSNTDFCVSALHEQIYHGGGLNYTGGCAQLTQLYDEGETLQSL